MLEKIVTTANNIIWSTPLVILCLLTGVFFSIYLKFPQFRYIKKMAKYTVSGEKSDSGITPFQAFASTVGSRVGMGNIAGVATAIFFGGPGAVFWMWLIALLGAASSFAETVLAQAYKTRMAGSGDYIGGPAHFIEKGLKFKPLAILFAIAAIIGPGLTMPGIQTQSTASVLNNSFGIPNIAVAIVMTVLIAAVICGSVKRIGKVAELLSPVMCVIYILLGIIVIVMRWEAVGPALGLIFKSAFGAEQAFAGIMGSTIAWGVKRGVYSNEAGQGSGAIVAAAAETSHPVKQGLVQAFSIYVDTIVVCTVSAIVILCSGFYNVQAADGSLIVNGAGNVDYGILYAQNGLNSVVGNWGGAVMAVCAVLFVFTSLMGYYYQAESNVNYLFHDSKGALWGFRCIFLLSVFAGVLINNDALWSMGDLGCGLMAWFNIIAILLMCKKVKAILNDFESQDKLGVDPCFDPKDLGIEDTADAWANYAAKKHSQVGESAEK